MTRSLLIPEQPALDGRWSERLIAIVSGTAEIYMHLGPKPPQLAAAYNSFKDSGYQAAPNLNPGPEDELAMAAEKTALQTLLADIQREEEDPMIASAYAARINDALANAGLYEAARRNDKASYERLNRQLYGLPDEHIYAAVCQTFRTMAGQWRGEFPALQARCDQVLEVIPLPQSEPAGLQPDAAVFDRQREMHFADGGFYALLFEGAPVPGGVVTEAQGDPILMQLLKNLESDYRIIDAPDSYWGMRHSLHLVVRPARYNRTAEEFIAVVGHEIGSHLLERMNGLRQPLRLVGLGLAGVEKANEGRALLREQVAYHDWRTFAARHRWYEILRRHFAISYAVGIGGRPKTFAEVYATLYGMDLLWELAHGAADDKETEERVSLQTWELTARVLNGTDGTGGAYYKDIVYLEGNVACWKLAAESEDIIRLGDLGKFNITDESQRRLVLGMNNIG